MPLPESLDSILRDSIGARPSTRASCGMDTSKDNTDENRRTDGDGAGSDSVAVKPRQTYPSLVNKLE